ncbi:ABC transporter ATP-binding protein [Cohnella pontilimi]|uniref:ABC transporter ATP-binding protein n=1 Tax=Cohnella pontilimi TaxID=2564100 RepID=A0A4U0FAR0_9BACL|nr:ABC transporter ATP-binding protein [Cohnella pontilimi]TJY41827.1 ABC transporter ATP-binding protein [Cohnella pontilimi]
MRNFRKYIRKYGKFFSVAILFLTIEAVCDLLLPTVMSRMIDNGVARQDLPYIYRLGGLMLLITAAGAVAALIRNFLASRVSQNFGAELRSDLYRKIHTFSFQTIDKFERPSLMTRLTNDVTQVQNFVNGLMRIFVKAPLICIGSLIMAANLNPHLAVVLAVVVPLVGGLIALNMRIGFPLFAKVQHALDRINGTTREYLSGVRVVKAFNRFDHEMEKFDSANENYQERSTIAMRVMSVFSPGVMLIVNFGIVAVIWIGGIRVDAGQMQVGHIMAFIHYMTQILFSLLMIAWVFNMFVRAKTSAERISEILSVNESAERRESVGRAAVDGTGRVDFENVVFSYDGASGDPILKNITLTCLPGETVGIIGSTGSGKSSLVQLIPRFYDVTGGAIRIDGQDIRSFDPHELREKIAVVPQKSILFTGTIRENILWGKEDASSEEVRDAARMAQADEFIASFPEGYDTLLGQGGVNLSGGQKQRLSIARALVRRPEILILDDSTSAVDTATESRIKEAIRQYARGMTCLIIAQRITSVMDADKIVVLDNGEIVGVGRHEELMQSCVAYQEIYRSQIGKEVTAHV